MGLDIGPATARAFAAEVKRARIVLWNGPMGVFEMKPFAEGTLAIARALAESDGTTVVGGGDSVAAITQMGLADRIDHVSTGGGASLEFLAGEPLPGVACLEDQMRRQLIAGNWKMYKTVSAGIALAREIAEGLRPDDPEVVVFPPATALARRGPGHEGHGGQGRRAEHALRARGRVHGRDLPADAEGRGLHARPARALRAPPRLRRGRRARREEDRAPRPTAG